MATILEKYNEAKTRKMEQAMAGAMTPDKLLQFQELMYRVNILETCMCLCKTAPVTMDPKTMVFHYKVVDAFLMCMVTERRVGQPADEKQKAKRETALANLQQVIQSCRKQFASFAPRTQEQYKADITRMVNTVLPAWIQYRETYTTVKEEKKDDAE